MRLHSFWLSTMLSLAVMWPWHGFPAAPAAEPGAPDAPARVEAENATESPAAPQDVAAMAKDAAQNASSDAGEGAAGAVNGDVTGDVTKDMAKDAAAPQAVPPAEAPAPAAKPGPRSARLLPGAPQAAPAPPAAPAPKTGPGLFESGPTQFDAAPGGLPLALPRDGAGDQAEIPAAPPAPPVPPAAPAPRVQALRAPAAPAAPLTPDQAQPRPAAPLSVAVYNNGRALVSEVRALDLPSGVGRVEFVGVPETIEPETLRVRSLTAPDRFRLLDMNYEYDLVSPRALLDRYVGKELTVILPDPASQGRVSHHATLVANNEAPVFRLEDGSLWVGPYEAVQLPALPQGLRPAPALVWLVDNAGPARQELAVSYLARGLSWRADYVLTLNRSGDQAALAGWVTLDNTCGMAFHDAALKLVAGSVHQAAPTLRAAGMAKMDMAMAAPEMAEEAFFEYHLYTLARPVDIANHQRKQVALLQSPRLGVERELVSRFSAFGPRRDPAPLRQDVEAALRFQNTAEGGLGMPLPQGVVRAYQPGSDGAVLLIGEDRLDHTPEGREVRLVMGNAFDVGVERVLTSYRKVGERTVELAYRITATNAKDEPVRLTLEELPPGQWTITDASRPFERPSAGMARFELDLAAKAQAPGNAATVTYTIRIGE